MVDIAIVVGTRPEAIKLAPVILALRSAALGRVTVITSGQHGRLTDDVLARFGLAADRTLHCPADGGSLSSHTARLLCSIGDAIADVSPGLVLGQGDTTTALAAALAASQSCVPFGHVEAGLRTGDPMSPFPEEMNRVLIGRLAALHFAPTQRAASALRIEGVAEAAIFVTGNSGIDALAMTAMPAVRALGRRRVLLTAHRRENHGPRMQAVLAAIADVVAARPDVELLFPMHPNPAVREAAATIAGRPRIHLVEPLDYAAFVAAMADAHVVVTDAGGVQEEAPFLGTPVLVIRDTSERPEAIEAGVARLVGTDAAAVAAAMATLLDDPVAHRAMARCVSPYGDGRAADRILRAIAHVFHGRARPGDFVAHDPHPPLDAMMLPPRSMRL